MNPLTRFAIDLVEAAVVGAAIAAVALPDTVGTKEALGLIAGGSIGALKGFARAALIAYIAARRPKVPAPIDPAPQQ